MLSTLSLLLNLLQSTIFGPKAKKCVLTKINEAIPWAKVQVPFLAKSSYPYKNVCYKIYHANSEV